MAREITKVDGEITEVMACQGPVVRHPHPTQPTSDVLPSCSIGALDQARASASQKRKDLGFHLRRC